MNPLERRVEQLESRARSGSVRIDMNTHAACVWAMMRGLTHGADRERLAAMEAVRARHPEVCARIESVLIPIMTEYIGTSAQEGLQHGMKRSQQ
jgi:hypothetical protein